MDYKMEILGLLLGVITAFATAITITSNGNSPDIKMKGGMMDTQKKIEPEDMKILRTGYKKNNETLTKLSFNERYRRLIPYMTFYYANDLATPTTDNIREVEVEKAEIIETGQIGDDNQRGSKKIIYSTHNIPRYQGNRLTQHNIASANPTKIVYQEGVSAYQIPVKVITNSNPLFSDFINNDYEPGRLIQKPIHKYPNVAFVSTTRKPIFGFYNEDVPNIRYYLSEKDQAPKYKLVPYKQTPPIRVPVSDNIYEVRKKPVPVPVLANKEQVYIKPRPIQPQYVYEEISIPQPVYRKPVIISDNVYERQRPAVISQPPIENGFKSIHSSPQYILEENIYTTNAPERFIAQAPYSKRVQASPVISIDDLKPKYYQYVVDTTTEVSPQVIPTKLLSSIQLNKSVPKPATKATIGSSIRTLLQALSALKAVPVNEVEVPHLSTPAPFIAPDVVQVTDKPVKDTEPASEPPQAVNDDDLHEDPYLGHVNSPSQYLEDIPTLVGTRQQFPPPVTSDDEGGTPGKPGVDYPILTVIPPTSFNCTTQRYKGFFADPETRCQVWHYCDLNGGQASFLCPNGTIFSQAGLTCDWWFNVRCASTTQLYVLNESLYKYILPHKPKFPEDYSGPLVDKYLTLKFKEMEEQFKKNKNKQSASEKMDTDENESAESSDDSSENNSSNKGDEETDKYKVGGNTSSEPSVIVESPGTSGNVERLRE